MQCGFKSSKDLFLKRCILSFQNYPFYSFLYIFKKLNIGQRWIILSRAYVVYKDYNCAWKINSVQQFMNNINNLSW